MFRPDIEAATSYLNDYYTIPAYNPGFLEKRKKNPQMYVQTKENLKWWQEEAHLI